MHPSDPFGRETRNAPRHERSRKRRMVRRASQEAKRGNEKASFRLFRYNNWSFTIFHSRSNTPAVCRGRGASIPVSGAPLAPFNRAPDLLPSDCDAQSGVGSRELLLGLVTQVCAPAPRTSRRLQPFPSARRLVAGRAPLTPANFRSSLAGLPPPLA